MTEQQSRDDHWADVISAWRASVLSQKFVKQVLRPGP
jgi:hypothetical protein